MMIEQLGDQSCSALCGGHCCRSFTLPYAPGEFASRVADGLILDGVQILEMVEYIGEHTVFNPPHAQIVVQDVELLRREFAEERGIDLDSVTIKTSYFYRCKNLTPDGLCSIYDSRPSMCRDFPYGGRCNYKGCKADFAADQDTSVDVLRG